MNLSGKTVAVTGAGGFLGKHVVEALHKKGCEKVWSVPRNLDLRYETNCDYIAANSDVVIHLAASVGGIGANAENPGKYFYDNMLMGLHIIEAARKWNTPKVVQVSTSCAYPMSAPTPVKETDLWTGPVNPVTGPYGIAKLALTTMAQAYRQQYGTNVITLIPVNLYGPGDHFSADKAHVIPAMIVKMLAAKKEDTSVTLWGTGNATREFIHVRDAARAIVMAVESYDKPEPVNIGSGVEVRMKDLAYAVSSAVDFNDNTFWDASKPEGQLRRCFDVSKAKEEFGFVAEIPFEAGLLETVEWYLESLNEQSTHSGS